MKKIECPYYRDVGFEAKLAGQSKSASCVGCRGAFSHLIKSDSDKPI